MSARAIALGKRVRGRCVTNYTEHEGTVIACVPVNFYSDGTPFTWRVTIDEPRYGARTLWCGTEIEVPS